MDIPAGERHAYCIIAHNQPELLRNLLLLLDDPYNDIYLHLDAKAVDFPVEECLSVVKQTAVTLIPRRRTSWGAASLVWVELDLLQAAIQTPHCRYHLLSGACLPLKPQAEIRRFFREHPGMEYLDIAHSAKESDDFLFRVQRYFPLQELLGRRSRRLIKPLACLQKLLHIDRTQGMTETFYKGSQWFSITHELASYVVERRPWIEQHFRMTLCSDEVFLQTLAMNSPFRNRVADENLRLIDWERGSPYTYTLEDLDGLLTSEKLFARKFDMAADPAVVERLVQHVLSQQQTAGPQVP